MVPSETKVASALATLVSDAVQTSPFYGDDDDKRCHVVIKMMVKFITYVW